jgi:thienamycin biosynthesis protein ThnN
MVTTKSQPQALDNAADERLRSAIDLHLHPRLGSAYWLARRERLGFDPRREVRWLADLHRLGTTDPADLRGRSVWDFVPKGLWHRRGEFITGETGGTSGEPLASAYLEEEFHEAFVSPFIAAAGRVGFPRGAPWLFLGPSGPHIIGLAARRLAREFGGPPPWFVDFDPRWAKKLATGSLAARRYLEHVLEQATRVVDREEIGVLFATPPVLRGLSERLDDRQRERIRGVHYGGLPVTAAELNQFQRMFPEAVHLSGYGNTLFGCAMEVDDGPRETIDYFPHGARLIFDVVAGELDGAAQRGPIRFHRLDRSMLLIGVLERDFAELIRPSDAARAIGFTNPGLRDPAPPAGTRPELKIGIY